MDAAVTGFKNMSDAKNELELNQLNKSDKSPASGLQLWADVFYGVLVAPGQTMDVLADTARYKSDGVGFALSFATVFTSSLIAAIGASGGDSGILAQLGIAFCTFFGILYWSGLSFLLFILTRLTRSSNHDLGSAFIVTGWAFVPVFFINPVKCLLAAPILGGLVVAALIFWIFALQWMAFSSMLRFNGKRMTALVFGLPILYKLSLLAALLFILAVLF